MSDPMSLFVSIGVQLKTATDIAIGLSKLHTMAEVNAKAIELQGAILGLQSDAFTAQAHQSAMTQRIRELEEEIARVEAWEKTEKRYKLVQPISGVFFYALKRECEASEPAHWICATCYEKRLKRIIQRDTGALNNNISWLVCPECETKITMLMLSDVPPSYAD